MAAAWTCGGAAYTVAHCVHILTTAPPCGPTAIAPAVSMPSRRFKRYPSPCTHMCLKTQNPTQVSNFSSQLRWSNEQDRRTCAECVFTTCVDINGAS